MDAISEMKRRLENEHETAVFLGTGDIMPVRGVLQSTGFHADGTACPITTIPDHLGTTMEGTFVGVCGTHLDENGCGKPAVFRLYVVVREGSVDVLRPAVKARRSGM